MASAYFLPAALLVIAAATSGATASASSCVNTTITNILGIGTCIGTSLNFCGSTTGIGLIQGVIKITSCSIQGIVALGSPQGIMSALLPLVQAITSSSIMSFQSSVIVPILSSLGLCGSSGCSLIKNNSCNGTIQISLPDIGGFGTCFANTQNCTTGTPTMTNFIQSLFQGIVCLLRQLSFPQFVTVLRGIGCQLLDALKSATQGSALLQLVLLGFSSSLQASLGISCTASA